MYSSGEGEIYIYIYTFISLSSGKKGTDLRTGERLRLCLEGGRRLGGLLRLGEIRLLGLDLRRGENDLEQAQFLVKSSININK